MKESLFLTNLDVHGGEKEGVWILDKPLVYYSKLIETPIVVPNGFNTDLASVPRIPIIFSLFGDRAHHESVIHDYLYRIDCSPIVTFGQANKIFLEAMKCRGKSNLIAYPMYWGVCLGKSCYHKRKVKYQL